MRLFKFISIIFLAFACRTTTIHSDRQTFIELSMINPHTYQVNLAKNQNYFISSDSLIFFLEKSVLLIVYDRYSEDSKRQIRDIRPGMRTNTNLHDYDDQINENRYKLKLLMELNTLLKSHISTDEKLKNIKSELKKFASTKSLNFETRINLINDNIKSYVVQLINSQSKSHKIKIDQNSPFFSIFYKHINPTVPKIKFIRIPVGNYIKGTNKSEPLRDDDEDLRAISITHDFELAATEVTQLQWFNLMGYNPSFFKKKNYCNDSFKEILGHPMCPNFPVEQVSFDEVLFFLKRLNSISHNKQWHFRLPNDDEWEYAARGGTTSLYSFGETAENVDDFAWNFLNSNRQHHNVGTKMPNRWGLYNMFGNVWEWIDTDYTYLMKKSNANVKIWRGGGSLYCERRSRPGYKLYGNISYRSQSVGFRLARSKILFK